VTLRPALAWNVGTLCPDAKGEIQAGSPRKDRTEVGHREPSETRGSRTVLGASGAEIPRGDSPPILGDD